MVQNSFQAKSSESPLWAEPGLTIPSQSVQLGTLVTDAATLSDMNDILKATFTVEDMQEFLAEYDNEGQRALRQSEYDKLEQAQENPESYTGRIEALEMVVERHQNRQKAIDFVKGLLDERLQASADQQATPEEP